MIFKNRKKSKYSILLSRYSTKSTIRFEQEMTDSDYYFYIEGLLVNYPGWCIETVKLT